MSPELNSAKAKISIMSPELPCPRNYEDKYYVPGTTQCQGKDKYYVPGTTRKGKDKYYVPGTTGTTRNLCQIMPHMVLHVVCGTICGTLYAQDLYSSNIRGF